MNSVKAHINESSVSLVNNEQARITVRPLPSTVVNPENFRVYLFVLCEVSYIIGYILHSQPTVLKLP